MRSIYFDALKDAVDNAVRLVYSPSVLAASPNTCGEVLKEVAYCRDGFEEMMALTSKPLAPESAAPSRINVDFEGAYSTASNLGQVYEWLLKASGNQPTKEIFYAIRLIYLPAAIAASPKTNKDPFFQIERSRLLFEQRMKLAIWESNPTEEALIANRLDKAYQSSPFNRPVDSMADIQKTEIRTVDKAATTSTELNQGTDDFDDEYVEIDRTLDTD
jgi:hypothetical protein